MGDSSTRIYRESIQPRSRVTTDIRPPPLAADAAAVMPKLEGEYRLLGFSRYTIANSHFSSYEEMIRSEFYQANSDTLGFITLLHDELVLRPIDTTGLLILFSLFRCLISPPRSFPQQNSWEKFEFECRILEEMGQDSKRGQSILLQYHSHNFMLPLLSYEAHH